MTDADERPINEDWERRPRDVARKLEAGEKFILVDCRRPDELEIASLPWHEHVPLQELSSQLEKLAPYEDDEVIVYCHHGVRSLNFVAILREAGFENAWSMAGGIDRWSQQIDDSIPTY